MRKHAENPLHTVAIVLLFLAAAGVAGIHGFFCAGVAGIASFLRTGVAGIHGFVRAGVAGIAGFLCAGILGFAASLSGDHWHGESHDERQNSDESEHPFHRSSPLTTKK